jgi:hypothetical protein
MQGPWKLEASNVQRVSIRMILVGVEGKMMTGGCSIEIKSCLLSSPKQHLFTAPALRSIRQMMPTADNPAVVQENIQSSMDHPRALTCIRNIFKEQWGDFEGVELSEIPNPKSSSSSCRFLQPNLSADVTFRSYDLDFEDIKT